MRSILVILIIAAALVTSSARLVNWVVATVGSYAITDYDIRQMNQFLQVIGIQRTNDMNAAFRALVYQYGLLSMADSDERMKSGEKEIAQYIDSITNAPRDTNAGDSSSSDMKRRVYNDFPEFYRMYIRKDLIARDLFYINPDLKARVPAVINEKETRAYFDSNRNRFVEPPYGDLIIIAVNRPDNLGPFDYLDKYETPLSNMAAALKRSDDVTNLMNIYSRNFKFEPYSGRTGLKPLIDILSNGTPEEALGITFGQDSVQVSATERIRMTNGSVFGPYPIPIRKTGKKVYIIIKIMEKRVQKPIPFEQVKDNIEDMLKAEKSSEVMEKFVKEKFQKRDIVVTILDRNFEGVYNDFLRR